MPAHALSPTRIDAETAAEPDARVLFARGIALRRQGRLDEAVAAFDGALRLRPAFPEALRAGADVLRERGYLDGALRFLAQAIRLRPAYLDAVLDCGDLLCAAYRFAEAAAVFDAALAALPGGALADRAVLLTNKGVALHGCGQLAAALASLEAALAADPALPQAHLNHGNVLARVGRHEAALPALDRAIALQPHYPAAHANRGLALTWLGRFDEAATAFAIALVQEPGNPYALTNRGKLRLLLGDYADGLPDYEARLATEWQDLPQLVGDIPVWSGQPLAGAKVVALADQGSGDAIHFARYVPLLVAAGADVTVLCRPRLVRLLGPVLAHTRVVETLDAGERFDIQIPFGSLPLVFATRVATIPAAIPYLHAEHERVAVWAPRLGAGPTIGLCWRGNQDWRADPHRSIPLDLFAPLAALPGVRLISLQPDAPEEPPFALERLAGLDAGPDGFVDTAAVISCLDLVVTCDTSIAHLAGALGRPTFLLLQPVPEWRWMLDRDDTPWYPSLRLFRQAAGSDWAAAVARVVAAARTALD